MESSGQMDEDIKAECIEVISSMDADSATTSYLSGENEAGSERNAVYMFGGNTEATSDDNTMIILDDADRDGNIGRPERETIVGLIEMVRCHPGIWDTTNSAYREKLLRKKSFRRIGDQLGWSTEDVIKKYNNLRTYYTKEIIKQKRSANYHSKWPYFQQLDSFLRRTVHKRQPARLAIANKWSRPSSRNTPDSMQFHVGYRRKRQMLNNGDVRQRSNFNRVPATLSTPPPETTKQPTTNQPSTSSSVESRMPPNAQINISHVHSLASQQQQPRDTSSMATSTRVPRQQSNLQQSRQSANLPLPATSPSSSSPVPSRALPLLQRKQMQSQNQLHIQQHHQQQQQQQQQKQQQQSHPRMLQQQEAGPKSPSPSTSSVSIPYQAASSLPPTPSGQVLMESNDVIFGRLVTSQLSRIEEGRKKEQLKINLMQQLVQAMFEKE